MLTLRVLVPAMIAALCLAGLWTLSFIGLGIPAKDWAKIQPQFFFANVLCSIGLGFVFTNFALKYRRLHRADA